MLPGAGIQSAKCVSNAIDLYLTSFATSVPIFDFPSLDVISLQSVLPGVGGLVCATKTQSKISASLNGVGSFSAAWLGQSGNSSLSINDFYADSPTISIPAFTAATGATAALFAGAGSLRGNTRPYKVARAKFNGTGSLYANPLAQLVTFNFTNYATVTPIFAQPSVNLGSIPIGATLNGVGNLASVAAFKTQITARFVGASSLTANSLTKTPQLATATLTGNGTLDARGEGALPNARLNGAGNFIANADLRSPAQLSTQFAGNSTLRGNTTASVMASAFLPGSSSLVLNMGRAVAWQATATLIGTGGTLSAPFLLLKATARFSGSGDWLARIFSITPTPASATFAGTGAFSTQPIIVTTARAVFAATGNMAATVVTYETARATLTGASDLTSQITLSASATARFAGAGALRANSSSGHINAAMTLSASLDGAGTLTGASSRFTPAIATFTGNSTLVANATGLYVPTTRTIAATLGGRGTLTTTITKKIRVSASFAGLGAFIAGSHAAQDGIRYGVAILTALGSLRAIARISKITDIAMNGIGSLDAGTINRRAAKNIRLAGVGSIALNINTRHPLYASARFAGTAQLSADSTARRALYASARLAGAGHVTLDSTARRPLYASTRFAGTGQVSLDITARRPLYSRARLAGAGQLTVDTKRTPAAQARLPGRGGMIAGSKQIVCGHVFMHGVGHMHGRHKNMDRFRLVTNARGTSSQHHVRGSAGKRRASG